MKRRDFLKNSLAAGITVPVPKVAFLSAFAQGLGEAQDGQFLTAHMIWSATTSPVPLRLNGSAGEISASDLRHPRLVTPDLHTVFAKELTLETAPARASIRLFAYTRYRLYVNGVYCGRGPGRFQNQRPEYDTRDIAKALRTGRNLIVVLVHRDAPTGRIMNHEPGFAAAAHLLQGSREHTIATDASWLSKSDYSFLARDEAWASIQENIDARRGIDLTDPVLSPAGWPASVPAVGPQFLPVWPRSTPLQAETSRNWSGGPQSPTDLESAKIVTLDLPEIIQGYHALQLDAKAGSEIEVRYLLPQDACSGKSTYIARQGVQTYMGGDTFAFNRLSLRLKSGRVKLLRAEAIEVRYPFERVGSFESSDPFLNKLWEICARSLELLSEDSYVDCADRERAEWTDDSPPSFDCTRIMMRGPDCGGKEQWGDHRLLKALLRRIALTQTADGQLKAHSCSERWDIHAIMEDRSCDWVILMREYFESSDDKQLIRELWPTLTRLMQWFLDRRTARGLVLAREWEVWDNPLRYQVCEGAGLNALVYRALRDAAWLGNLIGEESASKDFTAHANRLQADFNTLLWSGEAGSYYGGLFGPGSKTAERLDEKMFMGPFVNGRYQPTVQAALFALYSGIVPAERIGAVRRYVLSHVNDVRRPPTHYYLFHALYRMEEEKHDRKVLEVIRAGWKNQVDSPWQTTWEDLVDAGGSKAHIYGILPAYFLIAHVLGARRVGAVSERCILIEPRCGDLTWAKGTAVTEFGPVRMNWSIDPSGALSIVCATPPQTKATLRLYKRDEKDTLSIDGQPRKAQSDGSFIEVSLGPGEHAIMYPG